MHPILGACPVCGETLDVTRLHCRSCDTAIEGRFAIGPFERLTPEQLAFAETFIRAEGKFNRMQDLMDMSYPTLRSRLHELIRALGYDVGQDDEPDEAAISDEERRQILSDLEQGKLSPEEAMQKLQGG
jgi:hypothetical protein